MKLLDENNRLNKCVPFCEGLRFIVDDTILDLCGEEPQDNMDIYFTEEGKLSCGNPSNYTCHFIGNVTLKRIYGAFPNYICSEYSVYVVSIIKGDRKPARGSVELGGIK